MEKTSKKFKKTLGNDVIMEFDAEPSDGEHEYLDTRIDIGGRCLCWISYPELEDFMKEMDAVIKKYRI